MSLQKYFRVRQDVSGEIQTSISFIKDELQTSTENNTSCNKIKEKTFWLNGDGQISSHYESYGKKYHKNEYNIREYYISG